MHDYDGDVRAAKDCATRMICAHVKKPLDANELGQMVDQLNKAWDALTDYLVRQRQERDRVIRHLLDELAERKG